MICSFLSFRENDMERKNRAILIAMLLVSVSLLTIAGGYLVLRSFPAKEGTYKVTKIIDGDTFVIETGEFVRLLSVNSPEKQHPFYEEAGKFLSHLILDREVRLEKDVRNRDSYGRLLRYVYLNKSGIEIFVNYEIVRKGFAIPMFVAPDLKYKEKNTTSMTRMFERKSKSLH